MIALQAMADGCSIAILRATTDRACSATELVHELAVPASTVYRRINELVEGKLLAVERIVISEDGKKFTLYRSVVREMHANYGFGKVEVDLVLNEDVVSKLSRMWDSMRTRK